MWNYSKDDIKVSLDKDREILSIYFKRHNTTSKTKIFMPISKSKFMAFAKNLIQAVVVNIVLEEKNLRGVVEHEITSLKM